MTTQTHDTITRRVEVHDPGLSDEANALLTAELRDVIGADTVQLPAGAPDSSHDRHTRHSWPVAAAIELKLVLTLIFVMLAVVGAFGLAVATGEWTIAAAVVVLILPGVAYVANMVRKMTEEYEHLSPETSAILNREGIGDPDHLFSELLTEFRGRPSAA